MTPDPTTRDDPAALAPCPFCGGEADTHLEQGNEVCGYRVIVRVGCNACGACLQVGSEADKLGWCIERRESVTARAIAKWNNRRDDAPALLAEVATLRAKTAVTMGVGDGSGTLFVHGDYDSIKAAQSIVTRAEAAEQVAREAVALLMRVSEDGNGYLMPEIAAFVEKHDDGIHHGARTGDSHG